MKVLFTGGAGYIGSHTSNLFKRNKKEVFVFDNLSTGFKSSLEDGIKFIQGDILNLDEIDYAMSTIRPDIIIHFAAKLNVNESITKPLDYYENNFFGLLNVLKSMQKYNVKKIIFSSTAAVYGDLIQERLINEIDLKAPINPYGFSKFFCESLIQSESSASNLEFVILRYFNVAGADINLKNGQRTLKAYHLIHLASKVANGDRDKLIVYGTDYPTKDGTCIRDYIHVEDLAQLHLLFAEKMLLEKVNDIYNCGYGKGYSVLEVIKSLKKVSGVNFQVEIGPRRPGDPAHLVADCSKIKLELKWVPKYDDIDLITRSAFAWEAKLKSNADLSNR